MNVKKLFLFLFSLFLFSQFIFSQNILSLYNTSWTTVIPGKVQIEPILTSSGFLLYSDARTLSAFSENGKLLWEKNIPGRNLKIFNLPEDFILTFKNSDHLLILYNPGGTKVWEKNLDFEVSECFPGRDGRFFLKGKNKIACYGITGIQKWILETEEISQLKIQELPDGSIIYFLSQLSEGKTKGLRVSPFGELLEEILFSGEVQSAETCNKGILLTFSDGTAGFFSLSSQNLCENKWVMQTIKASQTDKKQIQTARFITDSSKNNVIYMLPYKNFVHLYKINLEKGQSDYDFTLQNLKGYELKYIKYFNSEVFVADDSYGDLFSDSGKEISVNKFVSFDKFKWNYVFLLNNDDLVFCGNNWTLNSYKLNQTFTRQAENNSKKTYETYFPVQVNDYTFSFIDKLNSDFASEQRYKLLVNGNYGKKEINWGTELTEACIAYSSSLSSMSGNTRKENSVFDTDSSGTEKILMQLSAFSDDQFNKYISQFLKQVPNKSFADALLNGIILNGYDPDQLILSALENLAGKTSYKDEVTLNKICDAVYSICLFMGRPAFNSKGKEILSKFLFPSYNSNTRSYARNTLKKIGELEL